MCQHSLMVRWLFIIVHWLNKIGKKIQKVYQLLKPMPPCTLKYPTYLVKVCVCLGKHPEGNSKFEMLFYLDFILHRRLSSQLERPHNITLNHQAKYRRLRYLVWITYNMLFNHAKCHRHGKCRQGCSAYTPKLPCE